MKIHNTHVCIKVMSISIDIYVIDVHNSSQDRDGSSRIFLFDALVVFGKGPEAQIPGKPKKGEVPAPLPM